MKPLSSGLCIMRAIFVTAIAARSESPSIAVGSVTTVYSTLWLLIALGASTAAARSFSISDLGDGIGLELPTGSAHLQELEELVVARTRGLVERLERRMNSSAEWVMAPVGQMAMQCPQAKQHSPLGGMHLAVVARREAPEQADVEAGSFNRCTSLRRSGSP